MRQAGLSDSGAQNWKAIRIDKSKTGMSETFSKLRGTTSREGGGGDSGEEQSRPPKPLSHRTGELRDVAGTPAAHRCQLCQHLLAGMAQQGVDYPAQPTSCLSPEPTQTALLHLWESWGWVVGGGIPRGLGDKWAGSFLPVDAEVGHRQAARRKELRRHQGHHGCSSPAQSSWNAVWVLLRLPLAAWGFSTKSGVFRLKTLQAGTVSFCVWVVIGAGP